MTGFDSRRVSWVTLREQAMNKRTGALSLADWISFDTRLFLPVSLGNPAHYTVLSLQCHPGGCRAAKKTVSLVSHHQALTSTSVPWFTSWWSLEHSASTLVLLARHCLTSSNKWTCPCISGTRQPLLSKLYKSNSTSWMLGQLTDCCFAPVPSGKKKIYLFYIGNCEWPTV